MGAGVGTAEARKGGPFDPLREPVFRRIWSASLMSNFGQLILGVAAAWEMTRLSTSPGMVALVQTALMLPLVLVSVPAGALADMFDRRKIAMTGLAFSMFCAALLTLLSVLGLTSPWVLLAFCSLIGGGVALYAPAWQASISEQVDRDRLPAAVALGTISYNLARSFGPAVGGLIVVAAGVRAAFAVNALCYFPLFLAFFFWRRPHVPSRLPPERIDRAIVSGARYVIHAGAIRTVFVRAFLFGVGASTPQALAPLVAKNLLHGNASTFGILLGAFGVGSVAGALLIHTILHRFATETLSRILSLICGAALILVGFSRSLPLSCLGLFVAGGAYILTVALFNISVQMAAPRWVGARALSLFGSALTGGIAFGSFVWGSVAGSWSVDVAIIASGCFMLLLTLLALVLPLRETSRASEGFTFASEPEVALALTLRSGPIVIEVDYAVAPEQARGFYDSMLKLQRIRLRNGGFNWSLARDIADPSRWTERYQCPTWGDYLRMRDRFTHEDLDAQARADAFTITGDKTVVHRLLERPFGSVRWQADSPETPQAPVSYPGS